MGTSVAGVEKCSAVDEALSLFYLYIQDTYSSKEVELICNELKAIARREDFMCNKFDSTKRTYTQVQDALSKINEKQSIRAYITLQMMWCVLFLQTVLKLHLENLRFPISVI